MTLWLTRAGRFGEYEPKFLADNRVYATWDFNQDMAPLATKGALLQALEEAYPDAPKKRLINNVGQLWPFAQEMKEGDWVVLPMKSKPVMMVGRILGPYTYQNSAEDPFYHWRSVEWFGKDIPRTSFDQDLLYSLGAFMTICRISRNDAEARVKAMAGAGWKSKISAKTMIDTASDELQSTVDLELAAKDQIARLIMARFKGHGLARLVDAVLRAQGYFTYLSPEGPDKGIDILAAPGPLGFGEPRLCVQVKSADSPVESKVLNELLGSMSNVQAQHGLLVAWGGFKGSIGKDKAIQFFRVRLWDQASLVEELLAHYADLDPEIRAELPLKRIWTISGDEDGASAE